MLLADVEAGTIRRGLQSIIEHGSLSPKTV